MTFSRPVTREDLSVSLPDLRHFKLPLNFQILAPPLSETIESPAVPFVTVLTLF